MPNKIFPVCFLLFFSFNLYASPIPECSPLEAKKTMEAFYRPSSPYSFQKSTPGGLKLTGTDIEIFGYLSRKIGISVKYAEENKEKEPDAFLGTLYSEKLAENFYFSLPYRYAEDSVFISKSGLENRLSLGLDKILSAAGNGESVFGLIEGASYANPEIAALESSPKAKILKFANTEEAFEALNAKIIDAFAADRLEALEILSRSSCGASSIELRGGIKAPVHFVFNKKTVPLAGVVKFNSEIEKFAGGKEYRKILSSHTEPLYLNSATSSESFFTLTLIGTIAFALSGIIIGFREKATFFATLLFAFLPSVGGGILRDVTLQTGRLSLVLNPVYLYFVIILVFLSFCFVKFLGRYFESVDPRAIKFFEGLLFLSDSLGQAVFIVIGAVAAVKAGAEPSLLWIPFFAFVTANGGGILRDLLRKNKTIDCLSSGAGAEISILCGIIFALARKLVPQGYYGESFEVFLIFAVICFSFCASLVVYYFKIPNITFEAKK